MSQPSPDPIASSPRRFLLLPEEHDRIPVAAPRIRRYRLATVGRRTGFAGTDPARARLVAEADRYGKA